MSIEKNDKWKEFMAMVEDNDTPTEKQNSQVSVLEPSLQVEVLTEPKGLKKVYYTIRDDFAKSRQSRDMQNFVSLSMSLDDLKVRIEQVLAFLASFNETLTTRENIYYLATQDLKDFSDSQLENAAQEVLDEQKNKIATITSDTEEQEKHLAKLEKVLALEISTIKAAMRKYHKGDKAFLRSIKKYVEMQKATLANIVKKRDALFDKYFEQIHSCETLSELNGLIADIELSYKSKEVLGEYVDDKKEQLRKSSVAMFEKVQAKATTIKENAATTKEHKENLDNGNLNIGKAPLIPAPTSRVERRRLEREGKLFGEQQEVAEIPTANEQQEVTEIPETTEQQEVSETVESPDTAISSLKATLTKEQEERALLRAYYATKLEEKLPTIFETALRSTSEIVSDSTAHEGYKVIRFESYKIKFNVVDFNDYYVYEGKEHLVYKHTILNTTSNIQHFLDTLPKIWFSL